jgi:pyruvate formate-lyase/glycerol dehydratase family glycyl radical enzyme
MATGYTERIAHLRDEVLSSQSTICIERAQCYTEIYQAHRDKPIAIRRALALDKTLREMTVFIEDGALIVGNQSSQLRAAPIFPEYAVEWIQNEIDEFEKRPGDRFFPSAEVKRELLEICSFWAGATTLDKGRALMSPTLRSIHKANIIRAEGNLTSGDAHIAVDDRRILNEGLGAYQDRVRDALDVCDISRRDGLKRRVFYEALLISLKALEAFIGRFAALAGEMATHEDAPGRKAELSTIGQNCSRIKHAQPQSFYQALQLTYFVQLVLQIESNGHSVSLGRLDQYLYPFYRADRDRGGLDQNFAMELLENTWVKLLSFNKIRSWSHTRFSAGSPLYQNVTIGGQTADGNDGVNDLSYLILQSVGETRLTQPNLSIRFHRNMDDRFLRACLAVVEKGFGMPAFNNDEVVIPALLNLGVEPEDALNYSAIGCIEVAVPGKWGYRVTGKHFLNFMRVLLAALRDGFDEPSGETFFPGTGSLSTFTSFDEVMDAWKTQVQAYTEAGIAIDSAIDIVLEEEAPDLLCSAFVDDCIERGLTIHEGGTKYDFVSGLQVGIANLGNSLAAIKKLVFEDGRISGAELSRHLGENFEGSGGERVRQQLLNLAPKYGNDDDYVDQLLREAYLYYIDELPKYRTIRDGRGPIGCRYFAGTSSISGNVPAGSVVPATPDGRKAGMPLAEGSSPSGGTDVAGPTAVFRSVAKLPTERIVGGVLLNQKLSPAVLADPASKTKLISMLRSFFCELRGWHVQYNVVDRETLLDAQRNPEVHRDLVVRVAGYSAFFTTLSPDTQNDIIARTEQEL